MGKRKVSIIVPVYNVEKYLRQCIDSILEQTFRDFEVILVDDGSTDSSGKICDEYMAMDERVQVIHKENGGLSDARNAGIRVTESEYCTFLDSDDFWEGKDVLLKLVDKLENNPDFLMYQFKRCDETGTKVWNYYPDIEEDSINSMTYDKIIRNLAYKDMFLVSACCKMVKTKHLIENEVLFNKGIIGEDIDWFLHLVSVSKTIVYANLSGYIYRVREGSITHRKDDKSCTDLYKTICKWTDYYLKCLDTEIKKGVLSFLSYEFYIMLGGMHNCGLEIKEYNERLKLLVSYSHSKKTIICKLCYRLLGYKLASVVFGMKMKNKESKRLVEK